MKQYEVKFFPNGRVYFLDHDILDEAIKEEKEILIVMNAWSGGYSVAVGANAVPLKWYDDNAPSDALAYEIYSYDVKDEEFSDAELSKFYKIIFTSGTMVRMKTGGQATIFSGGDFVDYDTPFEDFKQSWRYNGETKEEFEKLRFLVDVDATINFIPKNEENREDKINALRGYIMFKG